MNVNIFVIGDLVLDHCIFVKEKEKDQHIFEVLRREDTAGGAATSARALSVMNDGHTYLWGLIGTSLWGSFREVLGRCCSLDGARRNIHFRGITDETNAQMNTVTRLIAVDGTPPDFQLRRQAVQFNDYGHVHVTDVSRHSLSYHLERANEETPLGGIVINDLDMGCLNADLIKKVGDFARDKKIPLFVDPHKSREKYASIEGTAIMPNLEEWCSLVKQPDKVELWSNKIDHPDGLKDMALKSFEHLANFTCHIIKCGQRGAVLILPHASQKDHYAVYRMDSLAPAPFRQLGCGDVMTGLFAGEYAGSRADIFHVNKVALSAFLAAYFAVGRYGKMNWHRLPSAEDLKDSVKEAKHSKAPPLRAEPSMGALFMPSKDAINLSEVETAIPGLYSHYLSYRDRIEEVLQALKVGNWEDTDVRSIILGAPSGSGKTSIKEAIKDDVGPQRGIDVIELGQNDARKKVAVRNLLDEVMKKEGQRKTLFVVDELLKMPRAVRDYVLGPAIIDDAHKCRVRFLLIDSGFSPSVKLAIQKHKLTEDFRRRCVEIQLLGMADRPKDIPYIVAAYLLKRGKKRGISRIKIDYEVLLAITDQALASQNYEGVCKQAEEAFERAVAGWTNTSQPLEIRCCHLPQNYIGNTVASGRNFEFSSSS